MFLSIKKFLKENTNYLIAIYLLAQEEDEYELLEKALGTEEEQIRKMELLRAYMLDAAIQQPDKIPVVLQKGKIVKNDFQIASLILAGKKEFYALEKKIPVDLPSYDDKWLEKFTYSEQEKIKERYARIISEASAESNVSDSTPSISASRSGKTSSQQSGDRRKKVTKEGN